MRSRQFIKNVYEKNIFNLAGILLIGFSIIYFLAISFVVKSDGRVTEDLFGFQIPTPPLWTSYIPIVGSLLDFIFQFFSIHGLVALVMPGIICSIGIKLANLGEEEQVKRYQTHILKYRSKNGDSNKLFPDDPNDNNDKETVDELITVSGIDIDEIMNPNVYKWAHEDLQSLEDQVNMFLQIISKIQKKQINFIEGKLSYRSDKWNEIDELINKSTFPSVIKQELIHNILKGRKNQSRFLESHYVRATSRYCTARRKQTSRSWKGS